MDEGTNPALRGVPFAGPLTAWVSVFADDITVFVSRRLDIKAVKKAVSDYERIAGAKVNFDKSEGLQFGAWRGCDTLPGPFRWSDGTVRILGVWFGPDLQLEWNWLEVQAKVNAQVGIWLSMGLSLKGRTEACAVYVFPLILYRFSVLSLPKARRRCSVDRSVSNVHATGVWICLIWRPTGSLKNLHTWDDPCRGTQCGDKRRVGLFLASSQTQRLKVDVSLWTKHCLSASSEPPFVTFLGSMTFHGLEKNYTGS